MLHGANLDWIIEYRDIILYGLFTTLYLTLVVALLGTVVGVTFAWLRALGTRPLRPLVTAYVEVVRNTPFLIQLLFIFFGLPSLGTNMSSVGAAIVSMVFNLGAYRCEIVRAEIEATARGLRAA